MKKLKNYIVLVVGIIFAFIVSVAYHNNLVKKTVVDDINSENILKSYANNETSNETKIEAMSGSYSNLSNETCAWGFVRKPSGQRPEFYGPHAKVLDNYQGIYCGNNNEKVLYLTFDEGYENGYTASILDTLKEKNVQAVFFVTMPYVKQNPDLIKRMIEEGHIVGNHTVNHPSMPSVTDNDKLVKEVMELHEYISENFHYEMRYLRPPKGEYSERTVKLCLDLGYRHVLWSAAYADWDPNNQKGSDYAKKMIGNNFHNGSVILLHAVSRDNNAVLGEMIDNARNQGFEFISLDDFEY
ncbi:MAG: polysaccharide deacetylase family protein [Clostridia bacterium]|nr:polysaccharide deacetylase family protein [Clostridia bacterium]